LEIFVNLKVFLDLAHIETYCLKISECLKIHG